MWPPPEDPPAPPPPPLSSTAGGPARPGGPGAIPPGGTGAVPPAGAPPGRPWLRWAAIALGVVTAALVILAIILVTRPPSATPSALATVPPSPTATDTPLPTLTPVPSPTPTPVPPPNTASQQAAILFPGSGSECGANGVYAGCPLTNDLVARATRWRSEHPKSPVPLCRCQSTYTSPVVTENKGDVLPGNQGDPNFDAVDVALTLNPSGNETIVLLFKRQPDGSWLAFDTYCGGGDPANRLSAAAPTTC